MAIEHSWRPACAPSKTAIASLADRRTIARSHGDRLLRLPRARPKSFSTPARASSLLSAISETWSLPMHRTRRPTAVSAALEFGVMALKVKHIVVLGHAQCGGIKAFAEDAEPLSPGDFIGNWMELMAPAAEKIGPRGGRPMVEYLDAAGAGQRRTQPRQPDDLPAPADQGRARRHRIARRLFWCGHRPTFGARSGDRTIHAGRRRRVQRSFLLVRIFDDARLTLP